MKKITLFAGLVLASTLGFSQVITSLTSVPCNTGLEGNYPFQYAGKLDGTSTDWALPNIFLGVNAVSGPLEMINDGTPGMVTGVGTPPLVGVPKSALGCDTTNAATQDMTGKIAVVYRGSCEFGLKGYNAQKRGAIGLIIINHTGDAVGMAGGAYGTKDTIPIVQIGRIAGDDMYLALQSCPGVVTGFIGSKVGIYNDDMGSSIADILMPENLATPYGLANNGTEFPVDFGMWAFNYGNNNQNGVTATVDVTLAGVGSVYSNTAAPLNFVAPAGIVVDTQYFDLGTFSPTAWTVGTYTVTYTLNLPVTDQDATDNSYSYNFEITNLDYVYAKCPIDSATKQPVSTTSYSLNETTTLYDDFEVCIAFRNANAGTRGAVARGMTFSAAPVGQTMTNELLEIRAYQWNDVFTDVNTPPTFTALVQQGSGTYFYADETQNGVNVYLNFDVPVSMLDNQRYLFCIYNASDSLRIGHNTHVDYTTTVNNYLQPIAPVKDLPNGGAATWYRDGFGYDASPAISVTFDIATGVSNVTSEVATAPYPNPAVNMLTVPVRKGVTGNVTVEVFDITGKKVISENQTIGTESLKVNVASISNGAYVFSLTFADGSKDTFKVSVNR